MIIDHVNNAALYYGLGRRLEAGLRFLKTADLKNLPAGKNAIKGDKLFAVVSEYATRDEAAVKWEAHRRYIDIQHVVRGTEIIGCQYVPELRGVSAYNRENDVLFLRGKGNRFALSEGFFAIFFPCDAHRPGMSVSRPQKVRKVVVKVLIKE